MPQQPNFPVWLELPGKKLFALQGPCDLGRSSHNAVRLNSRHASRRHATIQPQTAGSYWLIDLGSTHGTYLNDHRIVLRKQLRDGDVIDLGGDRIVFHSTIQLGEVDGEPRTCPTPSDSPARVTSKLGWLLVADIEGFTKLSQRLTGDELSVLVGSWVHSCRNIIEEHGGIINKYLGDGFFANWWDTADADQKVASTLDQLFMLQQSAKAPFRLVLHLGEVVIGRGASNGEECLLGQQVNFAFRMEKVASKLREHVLISTPAAKKLGTHWSGQSLETRVRVPDYAGRFRFYVPMRQRSQRN